MNLAVINKRTSPTTVAMVLINDGKYNTIDPQNNESEEIKDCQGCQV